MKLRVTGAIVAATALLTTACSSPGATQSDPEGEVTGDVTLRMSWFGNDARSAAIQSAVDAFTEEHPNIEIETDSTGWGNYFDKLATQFAARDAPDVVMFTEEMFGEYAGRGSLLELGDSVDLSAFDPSAESVGTTADGRFAVASGVNAIAIMANPALFEESGIDMPDDTTWTWEEYRAIAEELSASGVQGTSVPIFVPALEIWLRQEGLQMFTPDGDLGFSVEDATEFFTFVESMQTGGALPQPSITVEQKASLEASGVATNTAAMGWYYSAAYNGLSNASGQDDLRLLAPPSTSGSVDDAGLYIRPDAMWSINAETEQAAAAADLIDFLVNDPAAGEAIGVSAGIPPNTEVRAAIAPQLSPTETAIVEFIDQVSQNASADRPAIPAGAGQINAIADRVGIDLIFGELTPAEAAAQFHDELGRAIS